MLKFLKKRLGEEEQEVKPQKLKLVTRIDSIGTMEARRVEVFEKETELHDSSNSSGSFDTPENQLKRAAKRKLGKDKRKREKENERKDKNVIGEKDYQSKKQEFTTWLFEHENIMIKNLTEQKSMNYFKKFISKWNRRKLDQKYYRGIDLYSSPIPSLRGGDYKNQPISTLSENYDCMSADVQTTETFTPTEKQQSNIKINVIQTTQRDTTIPILSNPPLKLATVGKKNTSLKPTPVKLVMSEILNSPVLKKRKSDSRLDGPDSSLEKRHKLNDEISSENTSEMENTDASVSHDNVRYMRPASLLMKDDPALLTDEEEHTSQVKQNTDCVAPQTPSDSRQPRWSDEVEKTPEIFV